MGCKSSSNKSEDFNCDAGLSAQWKDDDAAIWKSDSEGVGAYLSIDFKNVFRPTSLLVRQVDDVMQMAKKMYVYYNDTKFDSIELKQSPDIQTLKLPNSISTNFLRIEIADVYAVGFNGGAFMVKGTSCVEPKIEKKKVVKKEKEKFGMATGTAQKTLSCSDKFSDKFIGVTKGDKFEVNCVQGCADDTKLDIFGQGSYSM